MKCNVGTTEKVIRLVIGVIAIALGVYVNPLFYIITAIAFITALVGYCPVSHMLGVNTCKAKVEEGNDEKVLAEEKNTDDDTEDSIPEVEEDLKQD